MSERRIVAAITEVVAKRLEFVVLLQELAGRRGWENASGKVRRYINK